MSIPAQQRVSGYLHAPKIKLGWQKLLLGCGIASSVFWVATDIVASLRYDGYSYVDQTISELSAIDAPTRSFLAPLVTLYDILLLLFAVGIWKASGQQRALRVLAGLVVVHATIDAALAPFASMHQREVLAAGGGTLSDTLHLVMAAADAFTFVAMVGFGAGAFGKHFRLYSLVTLLALVVFGAYGGVQGSRIQDNEPTPWLGVAERAGVYASMLWIAVLATALLRRRGTAAAWEDRPVRQPPVVQAKHG